ncbi:MAG TPA: hemerythrin domain-containing protein [Gallionella sp.]|nr:hemerythrin domain-containing protein [Gallionella sp.]
MSMLWTEQLSIGNAMLDDEHRAMIGIVNEIGGAFKSRDASNLRRTLERLEDYAAMHFAHEEMIARAVKFPFELHQSEHLYLQQELQYIKDQLTGMDGLWSDGAAKHFTNFLGRWVIDHIAGKDMQMKPVLETYPRDFKVA